MLLPVVRPGTRNEAGALRGAAETRAEAAGRLSATLPTVTRDALADGFSRDLGPLLVDLVRRGPTATVPEVGAAVTGDRRSPRLGLTTTTVLALASLDPDLARMLGLYWHDPVADGTWDYEVVARHGAVRYPGRRVDLAGALLAPGALLLDQDGLLLSSSGGLAAVTVTGPNGQRPGIRVESPRPGTVAGLQLRPPVPAVSLDVDAPVGLIASAWRGGVRVASAPALAGQVVLDAAGAGAIDAVTWTAGPLDLFRVELHPQSGTVGDLVAYAWNVSPQRPAPVRDLRITDAASAVETRRLGDDGSPVPDGVVGLDWVIEDGESGVPEGVEDVRHPVRVLVARADRGTGPAPAGQGGFQVVNAERPVPAASRSPQSRGAPSGPDVPRRWVGRELPAGWHGWRVRGIDGFGRLGPWSDEQVVEVVPTHPLPPPDRVSARYLDPADPHLAPADRELADGDGAGLLVEWVWPAGRRIQAPHVEVDGEFRVLLSRDDPNLLEGEVLAVTDRGDTSGLDTDLPWSAGRDALAGERLRVGGLSFEVTANTVGVGTSVTVRHLTAPTQRPVTGPFTVHLPDSSPLWTDLADPASFDDRVHTEPAGAAPPVRTRVAAVTMTSDGAVVTLADAVPPGSSTGLLAGGGAAYPVTAVTGPASVVVSSLVQPDGDRLVPARGQACTLWLDASYRAWLPGVTIRPAGRQPLAVGLVAVVTASGTRQGRASHAVRVTVPRRTAPPRVVVTLPPEQDGDIPADVTEPADWYGRARYTLDFPSVAGAVGYRVLRVSTAALFAHDSARREPGTVPNYAAMLNREVMALAEDSANEEVFRPAHDGLVAAPPYRDTVDGRGRGRFVYRVRSVDASGNAGPWSAAFPLVEVRDVTPPPTPVVQSVLGAQNAVVVTLRTGVELDLASYRVWRSPDPADLADVRHRTPHAEVPMVAGAATLAWRDEGLTGLADWYYRVAAVDTDGNVSAPTAVAKGRPIDTRAPDPPQWVRAERGARRGRDGVALEWTVSEDDVSCLVERRLAGERIFSARSGRLTATDGARGFVFVDLDDAPAREATYRIRARDAAGNEQRYAWNPVTLAPAGGPA